MALDRCQGNPQFTGDFVVGQAIDLGQQKRLLDRSRQTIEQLVQFRQGLQDDCPFFLRRHHLLRQLGEGVEVGALKVLAAVMIEQYALGNGRKERAGFQDRLRIARRQYAHERVLRQVGGTVGAPEFSSQPAVEPTVMGVVEHLDGVCRRQRGTSRQR